MNDWCLLERVLNVYGCGTALFDCYIAGATWNCYCLGAFYIIQPWTMLHHFMQRHVHKVHVCLSVTCHLHFWQNDRDLLRATGGTDTEIRVDQHRKLTLEEKILPPLLPGFELATFRSRVRRSNHWAIPALCASSPSPRLPLCSLDITTA